MILKTLFSRNRVTAPERTVYEAIVAQARQPALYSDFGVPDTLDGRFDMIILHADAVMCHMQRGNGEDKAFAQDMIDELFRDMDRSLREMGVGDMGVGKRIKKMATVYYGRANAYSAARDEGGDAMAGALIRNVYAGDGAMSQQAGEVAHYAAKVHEVVGGMDRSGIRSGRLDLSALAPANHIGKCEEND
jgi:cytochrome b pre-mRNA-processing protein 3